MDDIIIEKIVSLLEENGYYNVEANCGVIFYTDENGRTHSISDIECESED